MPFYKQQGDTLLVQEHVYIELKEANKMNFTFPVYGWYQCENKADAQRLSKEAIIKEVFGRG